MTAFLKLTEIDPHFNQQAIQALKDGDVGRFMMSTGSCGSGLALVVDNFPMLLKRGIYEKCLLWAFTDIRPHFHTSSPPAINFLFSFADRQKLRDAGNAIPNLPALRIYRGIAGEKYRRPAGCAWTLSLDVACWFATRLGLPKPTVLVAQVDRDEVLAFVSDRGEEEVICLPKRMRTMKLTLAEMKAGALRHQQAMGQTYLPRV